MVSGLYISTKLLKIIFKDRLVQQDRLIQVFVAILFWGIPFISQFVFGIKNIFYFTLSFSILGMISEYLFNWLWQKLMGSRLYRYYKANILGYTSWYIFPYWGAAGLFFYGAWQILDNIFHFLSKGFSLDEFTRNFSLAFLFTLFLLLTIFGFKDYLRKKTSELKGFSWSKYFSLVLLIVLPILYVCYTLNSPQLIIYFLFTSITGMVLEGILGQRIKILYGENFWLYYRYEIFHQATSLLILPVWGAAALLAFLLFNLIPL